MEQLLLARRQLMGEPLGQMVDLQQLEDFVGALGGSRSDMTPGGVDQDEVVDQRQVTVCRRCANQGCDGCASGVASLVNRSAVQGGLTLRWSHGAGQYPQERGLATAVRSPQD